MSMNRTFVCASSCIKHYVQPFKRFQWDADSRPYVCLYCAKNYKINYKNVLEQERKTTKMNIRPDKLDLLFLISHFLDLGAGGRLLFITSLFYLISDFSAKLVKQVTVHGITARPP